MESFFTAFGIVLTCLLGVAAIWMVAAFYRPKPKPPPPKPAPSYVRRWPSRRRTASRRELFLWQEEYDRLVVAANVARRAGGLHGSSTATPVSGG